MHSCMGEGILRKQPFLLTLATGDASIWGRFSSKKGLKITSTISSDIVLGLPPSLFLLL